MTFRKLDNLRHFCTIVALGNVIYKLLDNLYALFDFFKAEKVAVKRVATLHHHLLEIQFAVDGIRIGLTHIASPARSTTRRACHTVADGIFFRQYAQTLQTILENHVAGDELVVFFQSLAHSRDKLLHLLLEIRMQVGTHTTDGVVVKRHTSAASGFEDVEYHLTLTKSVEQCRGGTEVHAISAEEKQVRLNARQLVHQHAYHLSATGHFQS